MANTYLINAGVAKVTFTSNGISLNSEKNLSWSCWDRDLVPTYTYYTTQDVTNIATIVFSSPSIYPWSSNGISGCSLIVGTEEIKLADGNVNPTNVKKTVNVSSKKGNITIGFKAWGNTWNGHTFSGDIQKPTLYMTPSNYTVTLNKGTGISAVSPAASNKVTPGNSLKINATVKTGYTWKNWTGTTTLTKKENTITPTKNSSYTANATANTYSVKYNPNGGTGTMSDSTHTYDAEKKLTANSFTRKGYTFSGWATSATGTKKYDNQQAVKNLTSTKNGTFNLYAVWTPISYKVNYYANGGEGTPPGEKTVKYNEEFTTEGIIFTKDGYILKEWNTNAGGTGTSYQLNTAIKNLTTTNNDSIGLYAQWKRLNAMFVYYNNKWREVQ